MTARDGAHLLGGPLHIAIINGAIGDAIAALPAVRHLLGITPKKQHAIWTCGHLMSLYGLVFPDVTIRDIADIPQSGMGNEPSALLGEKPPKITSLRTCLITHAFLALCDEVPPSEESKRLPHIDPLPAHPLAPRKPYVVFTPNYTSRTRAWAAASMRPVVEWVRAKGYEPVFLGASMAGGARGSYVLADSVELDFAALGTDLRNRTSDLVEALSIIQGARAVVGVDNGLLWLAGLTYAPIVAGYTTLAPRHRPIVRECGPVYAIEPPESLECRGCQSKWAFAFDHDFRTCPYGDYACTELEPQKFIDALSKVL